MTKITLKQIKQKIEEAILLRACEYEIYRLKSIKTLKNYVNHPDDPYWVHWICLKQGKRWIEAESIILTSPEFSCLYALDIIQDRWEEGEKVILSDPAFAYKYALDVIKGKWKEAEEILSFNDFWYNLYKK